MVSPCWSDYCAAWFTPILHYLGGLDLERMPSISVLSRRCRQSSINPRVRSFRSMDYGEDMDAKVHPEIENRENLEVAHTSCSSTLLRKTDCSVRINHVQRRDMFREGRVSGGTKNGMMSLEDSSSHQTWGMEKAKGKEKLAGAVLLLLLQESWLGAMPQTATRETG